MSGDSWTVNSEQSKKAFLKHMEKLYDEKKYLTITVKTNKPRTNTQNASIRLYWSLLAEAMNDAGFSYWQFIELIERRGVEVPWDSEKIGDEVWRRVQGAMYPDTILANGKPSTTQLKTDQVAKVYDVVNQKIIDLTNGLCVPFPNKDR